MLSNLFLQEFIIRGDFEEAYLCKIPAVRHLQSYRFESPITFFVGENGSGKSTLLEALAIACGFNPEGGTKNFNFATTETHSTLYKKYHCSKGRALPKGWLFLAGRKLLQYCHRDRQGSCVKFVGRKRG